MGDNENTFEYTTIDRLKALGYRYQHGKYIKRELHTVLLPDLLRAHLQRRYYDLPPAAIEAAIEQFSRPAGVTLERRNREFQRLFRDGIIIRYEDPTTREEKYRHLYAIDFDRPEENDFLVVNQLTVQGSSKAGLDVGNTRRPDMVVYINGLPLVLFELKNPYDPYPDVNGAHNQLAHYITDIPQLFDHNGFCVISDGNTTLQGMAGASMEWYAPWKSINGTDVEADTTGSMKTLIEGLFPKARLLDYLRHFIVHEEVNDTITKKGAKYHQFFAVRAAVPRAVAALRGGGDQRVGVIWHTQGSGKSLEMVYLVGILRKIEGLNPTIIIQVDRTDLDQQLYESFVAAKALVGTIKQAANVEQLRDLLRNEGGEVVCSTIEKFRLQGEEGQHPILSERQNVLVIADEAHRTQYNLVEGFAAHLRNALPRAAFLGFTGTPVDKTDANTIQLFGDYLHVYDMQQATEDNAVVPIYYEARHIPLQLDNPTLEQDFEEVLEEASTPLTGTALEEAKRKWSLLEQAAGTAERVQKVAADLLAHFLKRQSTLNGKAMVVCMSRRNCVALYDALIALPDCPEVRVVMTGNLAEDPDTWNKAGHITTHAAREAIKAKFKDPKDPLKIVIVRDMWLTGFDAPVVNTLYVDKRMKQHNLMQAIARVNRIFPDKTGGLIVDYIGIADDLRAATHQYTQGGGRGTMTEDVTRRGVELFLLELQATRSNLPTGKAYEGVGQMSRIEREDLHQFCYQTLAKDQPAMDDFFQNEYRLSKAFTLVQHLQEMRSYGAEVGFYQGLRKGLLKMTPEAKTPREAVERGIKDLLDESVVAQAVVDIYALAGLPNANLSILDDKFLAGFRPGPQADIQARLLSKLLQDEITRQSQQNLVRSRTFQSMLDDTIRRYNEGAVDAASVIAAMVKIREQQLEDEQRKRELGLSDEELAFFDVIQQASAQGVVGEVAWVADLVKEIVRVLRTKLDVDWTQPHREQLYAEVQLAVRIVLLKNKITGEQMSFLLRRLMDQAKASYEAWPLTA